MTSLMNILLSTIIYLVGVLTASQETDHLVAQAVRMGMHGLAYTSEDSMSATKSANRLLIRSVRFTQVEPRVRVRHPVD